MSEKQDIDIYTPEERIQLNRINEIRNQIMERFVADGRTPQDKDEVNSISKIMLDIENSILNEKRLTKEKKLLDLKVAEVQQDKANAAAFVNILKELTFQRAEQAKQISDDKFDSIQLTEDDYKTPVFGEYELSMEPEQFDVENFMTPDEEDEDTDEDFDEDDGDEK